MGIQTGTDCGKQMGIIRDDGMLVVKLQRADEGCPQFTQKMERPAEEGNMPPDWTSTGQTGDGLVYNSLENGCGEVFLWSLIRGWISVLAKTPHLAAMV